MPILDNGIIFSVKLKTQIMNKKEALLIQIGKLVILIDEAEDNYHEELEAYKDALQEHRICGSQKPSSQSLKLPEEILSALNQKLSSLIKEFRSIKN